MAFAIGIFTSDPNLLRCELARIRSDLVLDEGEAEALGAGWYAEDSVLLQRYSANVRPSTLDLLAGTLESDALLVHSAPLHLGLSLEDNTQPFRFRSWLFANLGQVAGQDRFRSMVMDILPDHLARSVRGATVHELAFAVFLKVLRDTGRTDDTSLDAATTARAMGKAARLIEQLALESGARSPSLAMIATNNHVMAAARLGEAPLYYRLLEGTPTCDVCKLDGSPEMQNAVREHTRRRTVVIASQVKDTQGWIPVDSASAVGVGRNLNVERLTF